MKEFTSLIQVKPVGSTDTTIAKFMADHFDFTPSSADDEAGTSWNCDKTFVIDKPSDSEMQRFHVPRNAIVTLKDSTGTQYDIGSDEVPARVQIVGHLQKAQLILTCTMLHNPLE